MKKILMTPTSFIFIRLVIVLSAISIGWGEAMAAGEKFSDQGRKLAAEIDRELINRGLCKDARDCYDKLPMYGEHGNRINFNLYEIGDKNKRAMAAIVMEFVIKRGMEITGGIPINIQAFPKPHDEYVNFKNLFSKNPIIKLEVTE